MFELPHWGGGGGGFLQVPMKCYILKSILLFIITFSENDVLTDDRREVTFVELNHLILFSFLDK